MNPTAEPAEVVGYVRVSTAEQASSGAGLGAQRVAIDAECARRSWSLVDVFEDAGISGSSLKGRDGLRACLRALQAGHAGVLVVAKLDRLSRSVGDFAGLVERSRREGWQIVVLDLGVDTTTPNGELIANVMAAMAQWERRLIGQRTKDALAIKKAQGVRLGRPPATPREVSRRIVAERAAGQTFQAIADGLIAEAVPTVHGGELWRPSTVRALLLRAQRESVLV